VNRDPFLPEHEPEAFRDPKPLKCPPYEPDPSQSCPHLHCVACKFKLAFSGYSYSCFGCDAIYTLRDLK
jgi:hypothetical protein